MRALLVATLLVLSACAHRQAELSHRIDATSERVAQLEVAVQEGETDVQRIRDSLAAHAMGHQELLERLDSDLERLQSDLEAWHLELRQLNRYVRTSLRADERWQRHVDGRLEHIEGMLGVKAPPIDALEPEPPPPEINREDASELLPPDLPQTASGLLTEAQKQLRADHTEVARVILEHGLEHHEEADEAAEMRYRLAETWFQERRWGKAATAFQAVAEIHPESEWGAWALVRQGECHSALGDSETARIYFEDAVRLHPETKAAEAAKKLTDSLL